MATGAAVYTDPWAPAAFGLVPVSPGSVPANAPPATAKSPSQDPWADFNGTPGLTQAPVQATTPPTARDPWADFNGVPPSADDDPWAPHKFGLIPAAASPTSSSLQGYPPAPTQPDPPGFFGRVGHAVDQVGRSLAQGATFGFGDEIAAGADAATHAVLGRGSDAPDFSSRYDANLASERAKDAAIPSVIAVPGQILGGAAAIVSGAPAAAVDGAGAAIRLIPVGANLLSGVGAGTRAVGTALSRIPGVAAIAPAAGIAAEGAGYGAVQGFGDGQGGFDDRLQSAKVGAETGAVLAPVVAGGVNAVVKGSAAVQQALSRMGIGAKTALTDASGASILGSDGAPVTATSGVAQAAGRQIDEAASDPAAVRATLAQPPTSGFRTVDAYPAPDGNGMTTIAPEDFTRWKAGQIVPGSQPTTFQATNDTGLGQKELALRNAPGSSQPFIDRASQQNAARVQAVAGQAPADASSADLVNGLTGQRDALATQQQTAVSQAQTGTLQGVGGATDSAPTQAGAALRGAVDQARAPAVQEANAAVQQEQQRAAGAMDALGGNLPDGSTSSTAAQQFGRQFRDVLDNNAQGSKAAVGRLYDAIDPDGTLAVNMQPARQAALNIKAALPQNAAPLSGEEAAIFGTMEHLPDAQSFRELGALNNRVTTAMRAARSDPAQAQTYARLSQIRGGLADNMQNTVQDQAGQEAAAVQAGTMAPEATMLSRIDAQLRSQSQDFLARQSTAVSQAGGDVGYSAGGYSSAPSSDVHSGSGGSGQGGSRPRDAPGNPSLQSSPPLVANADQAAVDRITAANTGYAQHKATYGVQAPGVGPVLAPGSTSGTFRMADSAVPSAIFSKGAGAAERVQAAVQAGLPPSQIAQYAAYDLRRVASNSDGSLNPQAAARWRQNNGEAFQALTQADPSIRGRFDTAQQQAARLADLQTQRTALDATHPLNPGWGDAEVMQRVWQPGPKGADSVRNVTSAAGGSPVASSSIADYAAYSLRKMAAPDGVLDPARYVTWAKAYDGALSARPDTRCWKPMARPVTRTCMPCWTSTAAFQRTCSTGGWRAACRCYGSASRVGASGRPCGRRGGYKAWLASPTGWAADRLPERQETVFSPGNTSSRLSPNHPGCLETARPPVTPRSSNADHRAWNHIFRRCPLRRVTQIPVA